MYSDGESYEGSHSKHDSGSGMSRSGGSPNTAAGSGGGGGSPGRENEVTELSADSHGSDRGESSKHSTSGNVEDTQRLRDEFSVTLFKFSTVLEETITALQGVFNLEEPDFMPSDSYPIDPPRDFAMIPKISRLFRVWGKYVFLITTSRFAL